MPLGLTRKEQWALLGTIGVIVAAVGWRSYQQQPGSDMVYVEGQGYWKRLSSQEAKGAQAPDPNSKAAPTAINATAAPASNATPAAIQPGIAIAPPVAAGSPTPASLAQAPKQPAPVQPLAGQRPLPSFAPAPTPSISLAPAIIKPPPSSQYLAALAAAPLDLNTATEQQLEELPSIGPVKATAIVQLRLRLGRYNSVDQLEQVSGIGPATLAKIRPYVRVAPVR